MAADGAKWIWDRVDDLAYHVGIDRERVTQVLDWFHAVETLHAIAAIPTRWGAKRRTAWVRKAKRHLARGQVSCVAMEIKMLAVGRRAKEVSSHLAYFTRNAARMQYQDFKKRGVPRGSGAIESAVRRIINLRIKSNAKFWLEKNAQAMLLMRSYLKAGRFDDLIDWTQARTASWWCSDPPELLRFAPPEEPKASVQAPLRRAA